MYYYSVDEAGSEGRRTETQMMQMGAGDADSRRAMRGCTADLGDLMLFQAALFGEAPPDVGSIASRPDGRYGEPDKSGCGSW